MKHKDFEKWLIKNGYNRRVAENARSRLVRVIKELNIEDIEKEFHKDKCNEVLSYFDKNGKNSKMSKLGNVNLPIGKAYMSTYKYAIRLYLLFMENK